MFLTFGSSFSAFNGMNIKATIWTWRFWKVFEDCNGIGTRNFIQPSRATWVVVFLFWQYWLVAFFAPDLTHLRKSNWMISLGTGKKNIWNHHLDDILPRNFYSKTPLVVWHLRKNTAFWDVPRTSNLMFISWVYPTKLVLTKFHQVGG